MSGGWSFIEHATNYLTRPRYGDPRQPTLWPSEATALILNDYGEEQVVGKCRRATFFRYMRDNYDFDTKYAFYKPLYDRIKSEAVEPSRYMRWVWIAGELYEDHLIDLAKESGVYIAGQVSVYIKPVNVAGKCDILAINPETNKLSFVEVKSVYGFNGDKVLGTVSERSKGKLGTPRDSNLMQIAMYHWWSASHNQDLYEDSRLVYGARDTGRYAEYKIRTAIDPETNITNIYYRGHAPNVTKEVKSPITVDSILEQYKFIQKSLDSGSIPAKDFKLQYSDDQLQALYDRKKLNKADTARHEKRAAYLSGASKRPIKPLIKGDWECENCPFKNVCYLSTDVNSSKYAVPRDL